MTCNLDLTGLLIYAHLEFAGLPNQRKIIFISQSVLLATNEGFFHSLTHRVLRTIVLTLR